jgi:hypothetical protein
MPKGPGQSQPFKFGGGIGSYAPQWGAPNNSTFAGALTGKGGMVDSMVGPMINSLLSQKFDGRQQQQQPELSRTQGPGTGLAPPAGGSVSMPTPNPMTTGAGPMQYATPAGGSVSMPTPNPMTTGAGPMTFNTPPGPGGVSMPVPDPMTTGAGPMQYGLSMGQSGGQVGNELDLNAPSQIGVPIENTPETDMQNNPTTFSASQPETLPRPSDLKYSPMTPSMGSSNSFNRLASGKTMQGIMY